MGENPDFRRTSAILLVGSLVLHYHPLLRCHGPQGHFGVRAGIPRACSHCRRRQIRIHVTRAGPGAPEQHSRQQQDIPPRPPAARPDPPISSPRQTRCCLATLRRSRACWQVPPSIAGRGYEPMLAYGILMSKAGLTDGAPLPCRRLRVATPGVCTRIEDCGTDHRSR